MTWRESKEKDRKGTERNTVNERRKAEKIREEDRRKKEKTDK